MSMSTIIFMYSYSTHVFMSTPWSWPSPIMLLPWVGRTRKRPVPCPAPAQRAVPNDTVALTILYPLVTALAPEAQKCHLLGPVCDAHMPVPLKHQGREQARERERERERGRERPRAHQPGRDRPPRAACPAWRACVKVALPDVLDRRHVHLPVRAHEKRAWRGIVLCRAKSCRGVR